MIIPTRHELALYEGGPVTDVWLVVDDDVWLIHCMDCGTRLGTVNAGNEYGAVSLTKVHRGTLHG